MLLRRLGLAICLACGVSCSKRGPTTQPPAEPPAPPPSTGDLPPAPTPPRGATLENPPAVAAWFRSARLIPAGFEFFVAIDVSAAQASPLWARIAEPAARAFSELKTLQDCDFRLDDLIAVAAGSSGSFSSGNPAGIVAVEGRGIGSDARLACLLDASQSLERRSIHGRTALVDKGSGRAVIAVGEDLIVVASAEHVLPAIDMIDLKMPPAIDTELQLELARISPRSALWASLRFDPTTTPAAAGMPMPRHTSVMATLIDGMEVNIVLTMASTVEAEDMADRLRQLLPAFSAFGVPSDRTNIHVAGPEVTVHLRG